VARTDSLLAAWQAAQESRVEKRLAEAAAAVSDAQQRVEDAEAAHARAQQALKHARQEIEKRIFEHDLCVEEQKPEDLIKVCQSMARQVC
jgi:4-hydroxyphenylpyruvate dioxygenase-like putative hemolysin